jgi:hypothetical protein
MEPLNIFFHKTQGTPPPPTPHGFSTGEHLCFEMAQSEFKYFELIERQTK